MKRTVLVTGAGGFIGSHLVDRLYADGHDVTGIGNFAGGSDEHLAGKTDRSRIRFIEADITDSRQLKAEYFHGTDWVFHLAARSGNAKSLAEPFAFHETNVSGTVNVLEAARKANVKKLIYAASSTCYGNARCPTPETAPVAPVSPYGLTKFLGEEYVMHWGQVFRLPVVSLRLYYVYGPKIRPGGSYGALVTMFLNQLLTEGHVTLSGDGSQKRDFTYVADAVDALVTAARSSIFGEIFNAGSGQVSDLKKLAGLLGGRIVHAKPLSGEIMSAYPDLHKIRRILKWKPKTDIITGIAMVLASRDMWEKNPGNAPDRMRDNLKNRQRNSRIRRLKINV
ncbi:hypothetical protein A2Z33_04040 [Candidatus Gottesmanbacteria bacterium RBG_16_52_11]|uniref:NAD-dependent epimerase/dehydratase domain-containing protein n=1 Tax=Candidatus Gottesmanbacteria bacterium RBG_16_52_11 TaxID=1798374 RepID=A0A1F5YWQ7_9BACT|nr:MAG: hypothetical protein A2Z33_04040 [Candidatus Gottesmanbacteria bacterium RBG_16_52_11]